MAKHVTEHESPSVFVAVGDFDEDDRPDIVINDNQTNSPLVLTSYVIYLNESQTIYSAGNISDGIILRGRGDETFVDVEPFLVNTTGSAVFAIADMNNDSYADILMIPHGVSEILIYHGIGNGSFVYTETIDPGNRIRMSKLVLADFNNDQIMDIAFSSFDRSNITVMF